MSVNIKVTGGSTLNEVKLTLKATGGLKSCFRRGKEESDKTTRQLD